MRFLLPAAVAMLALVAKPAPAALFETLGGPVGTGSTLASSLGLNLDILGIAQINIAPASLVGTADAAVSLDGSGNGTAQIFSSSIVLDDVIGSSNTPLGVVNYSLTGVTVDASALVTVTGGNFTIDSSTPGQLNLNAGNIVLTGNLLFVGTLNENIDLSVAPITVAFADLGASTLPGTADNSALVGNDLTAPGDEINILWNGAQTTFDLDGIPITITLTGAGLSIGAVPEPTSGLFLASLAMGAGAVVRRRRR